MASKRDDVAVLERIRELENEIVDERRKLRHDADLEGQRGLAALEIEVGEQAYLIPANPIREVVRMAKPQALTDARDWVLGVIPYGSRTIPLIDLKMRLEGRPVEVAPELFIIISESPRWLGFVVDGVGRVVELDLSTLTSPGADVRCAPYLLGMVHSDTGKARGLLSVGKIGSEDILDENE